MAVYKVDDVVGIGNRYDGVKCLDCMKKEDWDEAVESEIITHEMAEYENYLYFCDDCKQRLLK